MSRGNVSKKILDALAASTKKAVAARHKKTEENKKKNPERYKERPNSPPNWRGISESETSPFSKKEKHDELSKMVAKWRKKHKMKVADTAIAQGSGVKKKKLTKEKERLVAENIDSRKVNTYSMSQLRNYIKKALKATRRGGVSKFAANISDDPKPGDRVCHGEKLHEALEAARKRISEKS